MNYFASSLYSCFQCSILADVIPFMVNETVHMAARSFRVLKQIGEGGYSFVYQVRDTETLEEFALKKVAISSKEQLTLAEKEVAFMRALQHPNLLPLLESSVERVAGQDGTSQEVVYLLFPLYSYGSLYEEVVRRTERNQPLRAVEILSIFLQVCKGIQAMHSHSPALAHRDIKGAGGEGSSEGAADDGRPAQAGLLDAGRDGGADFQAVLMDFGSTREARVFVSSRAEAVQLQEDAEAHCSAPYRAPELYDVPSSCVVDQRIDVWSLGCLLYFMLYSVSPFERVLGEAGGSLALAVANGEAKFGPLPAEEKCTPQLKRLVASCLTVDPAKRPFVSSVMSQAQSLQQTL